MSGLILAGIGKGISDASSTVGSFMLKSNEADERARERAELQRERLAAAAEQKERDRLLRLEIAGMRGDPGNKGGGGGGFRPEEVRSENSPIEGMIARALGTTVQDVRNTRRLSETSGNLPAASNGLEAGDTLAGPEPKYGIDAIVNPGNSTQAGYPPGFEKEVRAKTQALARIEQRFLFGKDYKSVVDALQGEVALDAGRGAITDPSQAGRLGQGVAVMGGKDLVGGDKSSIFNKFTGNAKLLPVGRSQIRENDAQAEKARADAAAAPDKRTETEITRAEQALSLTRDRVARSFRKPTVQEEINPQLMLKYQEAKETFINDHADVKRQSGRLERLYTGGATQQPNPNPNPNPNPKPDAKPNPGANAAPSAKTVTALPKGAVQIGTSGGKPVYRTPDGKQFIQR